MYLSRVRVLTKKPDELFRLLKADYYQLHQLLWKLFPEASQNNQRDFLFRQEASESLLFFYVLSKEIPSGLQNLLEVEYKSFQPKLKTGDKLSFSLRANPVKQIDQVCIKTEHCLNYEERDLAESPVTEIKKRVHHDVVMHLKKTLTEDEKQEYTQAELEQIAGESWLQAKARHNGFNVLSVSVDSYQQHHFKRKGIKFSSLDFNGVLEVTEPDLFIQKALFAGIGRAKAFGCGLMLIRRI